MAGAGRCGAVSRSRSRAGSEAGVSTTAPISGRCRVAPRLVNKVLNPLRIRRKGPKECDASMAKVPKSLARLCGGFPLKPNDLHRDAHDDPRKIPRSIAKVHHARHAPDRAVSHWYSIGSRVFDPCFMFVK
jgi:hypothetical protein